MDFNISHILSILVKNYGIKANIIAKVESYLGGVYRVDSITGQQYIVKVREFKDSTALENFQNIKTVCDYAAANITDFVMQKFVSNCSGEVLTRIHGNTYLYLVAKQNIITKYGLTTNEQLLLGKWLCIFHDGLKSLSTQYFPTSEWMTSFNATDIQTLVKLLPNQNILDYVNIRNTYEDKLEQVLIHGDLHQGNISFTNPPFIFDLDTLSLGYRIEDIARTVTHWDFKRPKFELLENIIKGYQTLSTFEMQLISKIMLAICYRKIIEFTQYNDKTNTEGYKAFARQIRDYYRC